MQAYFSIEKENGRVSDVQKLSLCFCKHFTEMKTHTNVFYLCLQPILNHLEMQPWFSQNVHRASINVHTLLRTWILMQKTKQKTVQYRNLVTTWNRLPVLLTVVEFLQTWISPVENCASYFYQLGTCQLLLVSRTTCARRDHVTRHMTSLSNQLTTIYLID